MSADVDIEGSRGAAYPSYKTEDRANETLDEGVGNLHRLQLTYKQTKDEHEDELQDLRTDVARLRCELEDSRRRCRDAEQKELEQYTARAGSVLEERGQRIAELQRTLRELQAERLRVGGVQAQLKNDIDAIQTQSASEVVISQETAEAQAHEVAKFNHTFQESLHELAAMHVKELKDYQAEKQEALERMKKEYANKIQALKEIRDRKGRVIAKLRNELLLAKAADNVENAINDKKTEVLREAYATALAYRAKQNQEAQDTRGQLAEMEFLLNQYRHKLGGLNDTNIRLTRLNAKYTVLLEDSHLPASH